MLIGGSVVVVECAATAASPAVGAERLPGAWGGKLGGKVAAGVPFVLSG